jgi:aminobenzoyl-glutamate utilization protein B
MTFRSLTLFLLLVAAHAPITSRAEGDDLLAQVDATKGRMNTLASQIWNWAEVGFQEANSSKALQSELAAAGFEIRAGVAGMPTAFVASFRRGENRGAVIGLLAEFDALPGQSQAVSAKRTPVKGQLAGHACGHNLLGAGAVGAALALRQWMQKANVAGEIRLFGSPAEEGGSGKVYLARAGLFDDVDVVLHWHPSSVNSASQSRSLANMSGKFRFHGRAAHAARAPEQGRSALDAVEAMNFMINAMREHLPQDVRIHYAITDGGASPNVVPDFAEAYYYVRHVDARVVREVMDRVQQAAAGAALGTGTTHDFEMTGAVFSLLPNDVLGRVMDSQLRSLRGVSWTKGSQDLATQLAQTINAKASSDDVVLAARSIEPYGFGNLSYVSTDVGDVSWVAPTVGVTTATWVAGTPAHSWQATAASGSELGLHGMLLAAKAIALTASQLLRDPKLVEAARSEWSERRGRDFKYQPLLGDRPPALDYR